MMNGLETVGLTRRQEAKPEVAELEMLRFLSGVMRMGSIRNKYIRGTTQDGQFGDKARVMRGEMVDILVEGC